MARARELIATTVVPVALLTMGCGSVPEPDITLVRNKESEMSTSQAAGSQRSPVVIEGVDAYRVPEPLFECVRIVLSHRGEDYSTDYIQGISGAAFRIAGIRAEHRGL